MPRVSGCRGLVESSNLEHGNVTRYWPVKDLSPQATKSSAMGTFLPVTNRYEAVVARKPSNTNIVVVLMMRKSLAMILIIAKQDDF
jgi:hypothetical protein